MTDKEEAQQKFRRGDLVRISSDLDTEDFMMSHFPSDCDAIVLGSYADLYPEYSTTNTDSYSLFLQGSGSVSWYYESQLSLIKAGQVDLLSQWESERDETIKQVSDLDWIFDNGAEVLTNPYGASVQALANCFGLTDLWGPNGEGINYYENSRITMALAEPFLEAGDKAGWLKICEGTRQ